MRAFSKAVALVVALFFIPALAFAQSSIEPSATVVVFDPSSILNPVLELLGVIIAAAVSFLVARIVAFLPAWARVLFTAAIQSQLTAFIKQGIAWAIQEVEGFDKDKTISVDVGNAGVASALRYVLEHAPAYLINLAGGKDAIVQKIIAFLTEHGIVLDSGVVPQQVAATAAKST